MLRTFRPLCAGLLIAAGVSAASTAGAAIISGDAVLGGAQEVPPVDTAATGAASWTVDTDADAISVDVAVEGIFLPDITFPADSGLAFGAGGPFHIHLAPPGENGPVVVPFPDADFFTPTDSGLAISASGVDFDTASLLNPLRAGNLYFNLHTLEHPAGEIRGQITVAVPEPGTATLVLFGLITLGFALYRRHIGQWLRLRRAD